MMENIAITFELRSRTTSSICNSFCIIRNLFCSLRNSLITGRLLSLSSRIVRSLCTRSETWMMHFLIAFSRFWWAVVSWKNNNNQVCRLWKGLRLLVCTNLGTVLLGRFLWLQRTQWGLSCLRNAQYYHPVCANSLKFPVKLV